jgi:integrase
VFALNGALWATLPSFKGSAFDGEALELLWGEAAVTTWNARRAAVGAWLTWCRDTHTAPAIPAWTKQLPVPDSDTPARTRFEIDRLIAHRDLDTREKTLYRMLYETAGRAEEILGLNIEDLDVPARRAQVQAKGARAKTRRRGQTRDDLVLETVYWDAGTARLLPRLLKGRTHGPVFLTHRRPGPGTGWDLHEFRHSALTHLGENGTRPCHLEDLTPGGGLKIGRAATGTPHLAAAGR